MKKIASNVLAHLGVEIPFRYVVSFFCGLLILVLLLLLSFTPAQASLNTENFNYQTGSYIDIENTPNGTIWCGYTGAHSSDDCVRINSGDLDRDQYGDGNTFVVIPISGTTTDFTITEYQEFECCGSASLQFTGHKIELYRWSGSAYEKVTTNLVRHRNISGNAGTTVIWNSWTDMADATENTYHFIFDFSGNKGTSTVTTTLASSTGSGTFTWSTSGTDNFADFIPTGYEHMYYLIIHEQDYSTVVSKIKSIEGIDLPSIDVTSDITASTTWDGDVPVLVSGDVEIDSGVTLTINPGVVVKFDTATTSSLTVNGTLNASGTPEVGQIMMTSLDDDFWGDTNGNGTTTSPAAGDWGGIVIGSGGAANITNTIVRYAGSTSTYSSQIYNDGGTLNLTDSRIVYGSTNGVKNNSGTADIEGTEFAYNDNGLSINGGTVSATADNIIHDNSSYGIFNNTMTTIDAEDNFWGNSSGPHHASSNPSGTGDIVSDYVDFDPWVGSPHYVNSTTTSSVDEREIRWGGSTQYSDEWYDSVDTWNALGNVNIATDTILTIEDLTVSDVNDGDLYFSGLWGYNSLGPDTMLLNEYYLQYNTDDEIQSVIAHEFGHALGLDHSYTGNVMYYRTTPQTSLGGQDESDYYYLWP